MNYVFKSKCDFLNFPFSSYFRENWCLALYHDRFADFEQEVQQIMDSAKLEVGFLYFYISVRSICSVKGLSRTSFDVRLTL